MTLLKDVCPLKVSRTRGQCSDCADPQPFSLC